MLLRGFNAFINWMPKTKYEIYGQPQQNVTQGQEDLMDMWQINRNTQRYPVDSHNGSVNNCPSFSYTVEISHHETQQIT